MKQLKDKEAETITIRIKKGYIWPNGNIGAVLIENDESCIALTFAQAKSLKDELMRNFQ